MFNELQQEVEKFLGKMFERYGRLIARHPLKVIFIAVFINAGFGLGLLKLKKESGIEQYTPTNSTASQNREQVIYYIC